jgi:hypothetical protein
MTRPAQRLTAVECETCRATTTKNWSRVCQACTKALLAVAGSSLSRDPQPPRARASEAPDAVPGQAPNAAGQSTSVNAMSTGKRHDASR